MLIYAICITYVLFTICINIFYNINRSEVCCKELTRFIFKVVLIPLRKVMHTTPTLNKKRLSFPLVLSISNIYHNFIINFSKITVGIAICDKKKSGTLSLF